MCYNCPTPRHRTTWTTVPIDRTRERALLEEWRHDEHAMARSLIERNTGRTIPDNAHLDVIRSMTHVRYVFTY